MLNNKPQVFTKLAFIATLLCGTLQANAQSNDPLQARDLDGDPSTIEAYYYAQGNLTWLADANIGLSETFGLTRAEFFSDFGTEINLEGRILQDGLYLYLDSMNAVAYLGYSGWRLPVASNDDPGCSTAIDPEFSFAVGANCSAAEAGEFNQFLNAAYNSIDNTPFMNLSSNNGNPDPFGHWLSSSGPSGRHFFSFGGAGDLRFCGAGRCDGRYIWPVHDGDIGSPILLCNDPDGDGWGWNGVASCRVVPVATSCIDSPPIGDGWGWNGTESCRIETKAPQNNCEDTPPIGDGWGWNGSTSCRVGTATNPLCIDTDGDGWGWDGTQSCRVRDTMTPIESVCVDSDGDGWGWDGAQSCLVSQ